MDTAVTLSSLDWETLNTPLLPAAVEWDMIDSTMTSAAAAANLSSEYPEPLMLDPQRRDLANMSGWGDTSPPPTILFYVMGVWACLTGITGMASKILSFILCIKVSQKCFHLLPLFVRKWPTIKIKNKCCPTSCLVFKNKFLSL